jgi:hypothetical protein
MRRRSAQLILESQSSNWMSRPAQLSGSPIISAQRAEMSPVPCSRSNSQVPTPVVSTARLIHTALESLPHCDSSSEELSINNNQPAVGLFYLKFEPPRPNLSKGTPRVLITEARLKLEPRIFLMTFCRSTRERAILSDRPQKERRIQLTRSP